MNYGRFKKIIVSLALMCVLALPVATTFTSTAYAQSSGYSDVAQYRRYGYGYRGYGYPGYGYRGYGYGYGYRGYGYRGYYGQPYGGYYRGGLLSPLLRAYYRGYYG